MNEAFATTATEINNQKLQLEKENKKLQLEVENQKLQVQKIKQEREEDIQGIEDTLEALLTTVKVSGVILSATSADNIRVYVGLKYRELITDEGISAEVKGTKTVKGMIVKQENGFYLVPAVDKNGNLVEIDVSAILPGSVVKVIVK